MYGSYATTLAGPSRLFLIILLFLNEDFLFQAKWVSHQDTPAVQQLRH
jgi:hypothetical protein